MRRVLVCGAGGFVGSHLIKRLKKEDFWVRGVGMSESEFSQTKADDFLLVDLREPEDCRRALMVGDSPVDEVYQLAADMGGIGFISNAECDIMKNNALINIHVVNEAAHAGVKRLFFSSSVCVYRDMQQGERELTEADAIPANPDNEYGWEKLYAERLVAAYGRKYGFSVRIARFQTAYGPEGTWSGGREKAPAAICRKVSEADNGGEVEVWGDGSAIRSYLYIDDLVGGVRKLMDSDIEGPTNIGSEEYLSVKQLVEKVIEVSGKDLTIRYVPGPVGVHSRNFSNAKIYQTGWRPIIKFDDGIRATYSWIDKQVHCGS